MNTSIILDANTIEIEAPAFPWQHVRKMGEDIVATQLLFPRDHKINAYAMGSGDVVESNAVVLTALCADCSHSNSVTPPLTK